MRAITIVDAAMSGGEICRNTIERQVLIAEEMAHTLPAMTLGKATPVIGSQRAPVACFQLAFEVSATCLEEIAAALRACMDEMGMVVPCALGDQCVILAQFKTV
jgi:hypothetical protein